MAARDFRRGSRLGLGTQGVDAMLSQYLADRPGHAAATEQKIDGWLGQMLGPCTWSAHEHFGSRCQKPVPWTKVDMGGGRSEGASARTLYAVKAGDRR
ncbi:hypothetical protein [Zhihengliuella sp.]|uniref:hypothetical protein n=1 Tax=Zhihengliuella sp. TaxID=1954483 RepID=UPI0028114A77|nr:hypothetical protein [Zhihengliuella sp.]